MIYYIADMHFGHNNILAFDNRPYNTVAEMEDDMIKKWNKKVTQKDTVYVLGDMFWKNVDGERILPQLNGNIILIKGNHDKAFCFDKFKIPQYQYLEIKDNGRNVVLCHFPIPSFNKHYYPNNYHLYGHVHDSWEWHMMEKVRSQMEALYTTPCEMYNIGCMIPYMKYTPQTLDEIVEGYNKWKIFNKGD